MITDVELSKLDADQRRDKGRPDRRRRRVIQAVERIRKADELLIEFKEIMETAREMPGSPDLRWGALGPKLEELAAKVDGYEEVVAEDMSENT